MTSCKSNRNFMNKPEHKKSSKFLFKNNIELEKGPIKMESKKNIFNFDRKDSSIDGENNFSDNSISREFFSQDKKK